MAQSQSYSTGEDYCDKVSDGDDWLEIPNCIDSLTSSANQLRQLALQARQYYNKIFLCYGYTCEPELDQNRPSTGANNSNVQSNSQQKQRNIATNLNRIKSSDNIKNLLLNRSSTMDNGTASRRTRGSNMNSSSSKSSTATAARVDMKQIANDRPFLKSMESIVNILPLFKEFSSYLERCSATIESTIKRLTYYLNNPIHPDQAALKDGTFQLTPDVRIDMIFVPLMDLMFALVSLDETLGKHTDIRRNLNLFASLCKLVVESEELANNGNSPVNATTTTDNTTTPVSDDKRLPELTKMVKLIEYLGEINLTLCVESNTNGTNFFQQLLEHVQHLYLILAKDKTSQGFKRLCQLFEDYLIFYADYMLDVSANNIDCNNAKSTPTVATILINSNLMPTIYMHTIERRTFGLVSLFTLYSSLFRRCDKRVTRAINQAIQRVKPKNIVPLDGSNCYILLNEFLRDNTNKSSIDTRTYNQLTAEMDTLVSNLDIGVEFERLLMKTIPWMIKLKSEASDYAHGKLINWPKKQIILLDRGLKLADEIGSLIRTVVVVHLHNSRPMTKIELIPFFRLNALLKSIRDHMEQHDTFISTCLIKIEHFIRLKWRRILAGMQKRQISMKYSERKLDLDSIVMLSSICSKTELMFSNQGRDTQSICLSMLLSSLDSQNELQNLNLALDLLRLDFYDRLDCSTSCNQLYWHVPAIGCYYNHAFEGSPSAINELHYFHQALGDIASMFTVTARPAWSSVSVEWLLEKRDTFIEDLALELVDQFRGEFVDRVCQEFEHELRLQTHRDLYNEEHNNPFKRHLYNFKQLVKKPTIHHSSAAKFTILNKSIDLTYLVEQHLNKICYNLTSIAPHDWFTYDSMMNLARHKYNLTFVNNLLPAQTLDSGLDLLDITRNLALFASRYSYDLTNQMFIEKCSMSRASNASSIGVGSMLSSYASASSSGQSLNVIQIKHVARSIQTHGYGVLDSAVNCTYQTLKRLINLFSRQISDDKLRATLQKEHQQLLIVESSTTSSTRQTAAVTVAGAKSAPAHGAMSFEKATRIAKQFRLTAASLNESINLGNQRQPGAGMDLDSIRQTLTQLGNLLAFIRLIKSGALNCASRSVDYLPELDDLTNLRLSKCVESEFPDYLMYASLLNAAKNLDQCLEDFKENFSPKTNYLKIIVNLFSDLLSREVSHNSATSNSLNTSNNDNQQQPQQQPQQQQQVKRDDSKESEEDQHRGSSTGEQEKDPNATQTSTSSSESSNKKRDHLRLFFLLVPALIINYIDHMINCKERVTSRSSAARFGALLSDDGFALGTAFLLTVLGQTSEHNKLNWLQQTCSKLQDDIGVVQKRAKDVKYEESLRQTSSMTLRRLNRLLAEYVGLDHTLDCALLLFAGL